MLCAIDAEQVLSMELLVRAAVNLEVEVLAEVRRACDGMDLSGDACLQPKRLACMHACMQQRQRQQQH